MLPIKWGANPFSTLEQLFQSSFDDFETSLTKRLGLPRSLYSPNLDISEDDANFYIFAELPGLAEQDVEVTVREGVLTISGKKERTEEKKNQRYHRVERAFGEFARSLSLPDNVKENDIKAGFKNGLLELTLPKSRVPDSQMRTIPLNAERSTTIGNLSVKHSERNGKVAAK